MEDNFNDKDLYTLAVMRYKELFPDVDDSKLFAVEWDLYKNYKLKNYILAEAIKNNVPVEETETYKETFDKGYAKKL